MKAKQRAEYKSNLKRVLIYLLILFPIIIIFSFIFSAIGIKSSPLIIFMDIIIGGALCFLFEIFYVKMKDKKETENKIKPKKFDPYAD